MGKTVLEKTATDRKLQDGKTVLEETATEKELQEDKEPPDKLGIALTLPLYATLHSAPDNTLLRPTQCPTMPSTRRDRPERRPRQSCMSSPWPRPAPPSGPAPARTSFRGARPGGPDVAPPTCKPMGRVWGGGGPTSGEVPTNMP